MPREPDLKKIRQISQLFETGSLVMMLFLPELPFKRVGKVCIKFMNDNKKIIYALISITLPCIALH